MRGILTQLMIAVGFTLAVAGGAHYFQSGGSIFNWYLVLFLTGSIILFMGLDIRYARNK